MDIWSRYSIELTCPAMSHFHSARKNRAKIGMNVTAHQEKKENEETKTGKRQKQSCVLTFCGRSGSSTAKSKGECPGYLGPLGKPTAISIQPKRVRGPHHHVKAAVDWCRGRLQEPHQ